MTDLIVLNQAAVAGFFAMCVIVFPAIMFGTYIIGRWSAWRRLVKEASMYADKVIAEQNTKLSVDLANRKAECRRLLELVENQRRRIESMQAIIKAARMQGSKATDILTTVES